MKTALYALIFSCALIATSASYAQTSGAPPSGSPAAATTSGGMYHHPGPCHDDVQKFCSTVKKGGGRVLACLKEHEGQLSPRCEAGMKKHASSGQSSAPSQGAPVSPASTPAAK